MGLSSWLAEFFDTQVRVDRAELALLRSKVHARDGIIDAMSDDAETLQARIDHMAKTLAEAALTITALRNEAKTAIEALKLGSRYIAAELDAHVDELELLSPRSKKREPLAAVVGAVREDLKVVDDAIKSLKVRQ